MTDVTCVIDAKAHLGEGLSWDTMAQCLWWIDIYGKAIHRYEPATGNRTVLPTPEYPGCLAPRERGGLILSMTDGFFFCDFSEGTFEAIVDPEPDIPTNRFNDGKTDRQGRFWCGSMFDAPGQAPQQIASLYRLDTDLSCHRMVEGIGCSNGLAWSPDSRTMYFTDSFGHVIWAWDFDASTGTVENRRVFIDLTSIDGIGDGATVDTEGCYWVTVPYKGKVLRYDPDGKLMQSIELPTDVPTCCEFGGKNLDTLYVTTATFGRAPEELAKQPQAGGLFALDPGVKGLPQTPFKG
jgi:L-arabinonolactonase